MDNNALMEQWLQAQSTFWQSLEEGAGMPEAPWQGLIEAYQNAALSQPAPSTEELAKTLLQQRAEFLRMGRTLLEQLSQPEDPSDSSPETPEPFQSFANWLQESLSAANQQASDADAQATPDRAAPEQPSARSADTEEQSPTQQWLTFQRALTAMTLEHTEICRQTSLAVNGDLTERSASLSLGQLTELWCHHYEACHAARLQTSTYQHAYGRLTNAWLRLRKAALIQQHQQARHLGLASQLSQEQQLRSHHQLKRELRSTRRSLAIAHQELDEMRKQAAQIESLKQAVEDLQTALAVSRQSDRRQQPEDQP